MSLGWQCESALLPSNSKPINVDGKSLVGLKALLFDQQQLRAKEKDSKQGYRSSQGNQQPSSRAIKDKDEKAAPRHSGSKKENAEDSKEHKVLAALTAKSKLYEEISQGKLNIQSDLVNFEDRPNIEVPAKRSLTLVPPPLPPSMPNPAKTTSKQVITQQDHLPRSAVHVVSMQPQWNWSTNYATGADETAGSEVNNANYNSEYKSNIAKEVELKRTIDERYRVESEKMGIYGPSTTVEPTNNDRMSESARVKTQWEKTLNSSARGYLDQVHEETVFQREVKGLDVDVNGGQKRSLREEKLELIRQKRSKSGLT